MEICKLQMRMLVTLQKDANVVIQTAVSCTLKYSLLVALLLAYLNDLLSKRLRFAVSITSQRRKLYSKAKR